MYKVSKLELEDVTVAWEDPEISETLQELYPKILASRERNRRQSIFPLCEQTLSFELEGVDSAVSSAFMRVMCQELTGTYLHCPEGILSTESTEEFIIEEFITYRIQNLPLRHNLPEDEWKNVKLGLEKSNPTSEVISVYAGDFKFYRDGKPFLPKQPMFNPTQQIAFLNPGKYIKIEGVTIAEGTGRIFTGASVAIRGTQRPLDMKELPREETHEGMQGKAQLSGYVASPLNFHPRRHYVQVTIPAALEGSRGARRLPLRAAQNLLRRLRMINTVIERSVSEEHIITSQKEIAIEGGGTDSSYWLVERSPEGESDAIIQGVLNLRAETQTVAQLLRETLVQKVIPSVSMIGVSTRVDTNAIQLKIRHRCSSEDLTTYLIRAVKDNIEMFGVLASQLEELA